GMAVQALHLRGDRLAQRHDARHGRILAVPGRDGRTHQFAELLIHGEIGAALAEADRAGFLRQLAHHRANGGAHMRELALELHGHGPKLGSAARMCESAAPSLLRRTMPRKVPWARPGMRRARKKSEGQAGRSPYSFDSSAPKYSRFSRAMFSSEMS